MGFVTYDRRRWTVGPTNLLDAVAPYLPAIETGLDGERRSDDRPLP